MDGSASNLRIIQATGFHLQERTVKNQIDKRLRACGAESIPCFYHFQGH
jgi:hypothetical protein